MMLVKPLVPIAGGSFRLTFGVPFGMLGLRLACVSFKFSSEGLGWTGRPADRAVSGSRLSTDRLTATSGSLESILVGYKHITLAVTDGIVVRRATD